MGCLSSQIQRLFGELFDMFLISRGRIFSPELYKELFFFSRTAHINMVCTRV